MCLYSRLIRNPKYKKTKKNGGIIPPIYDERITWVPIGCGNCIECRRQKAREWQVRLQEDIRTYKNGKFVTLTFSDESIKNLIEQKPTKKWEGMIELEGYDLDNEIATRAVHLFLERWRKETGKSVRHWLITELGHNGTNNIHLHGIIWTDTPEIIRKHWNYGYIWPRNEPDWKNNYVNAKTINYIIKYITKLDNENKTYKAKLLNSKGIGGGYTKRMDSKNNKYNENQTNETYTTRSGHKIAMPTYWRNKIYSENEREKLWIEKLNKNIRYVMKEKIDISKGEEDYYKVLEFYQKKNAKLGYGNAESNNWTKKQYEKQRRNAKIEQRINNVKQKEPTERTHLSNNKKTKETIYKEINKR